MITEKKKVEIGQQLADVWREDGVYSHLGQAAVRMLTPVLLSPPNDEELSVIAGCDTLVSRYIREGFRNRILQLVKPPDPAIQHVENIMRARGWSDPEIWAPVIVSGVDSARKVTA